MKQLFDCQPALKPFSRDRVLAAVERARVWIAAAQRAPVGERLREVIDGSRFQLTMRDGTTLSVSRQGSRLLRERGC